MKINANFFAHHKTRRLQKTLGNDGVVSLIKLWGYAEQFRKDGVYSLHDWADWSEEKFGSLLAPTGEPFPPREECDYQVDLESCDDSDEYAALIRKGIEVIPVDIFNTGKSEDELRKESMGAHYDDYNAMMARTRGAA